MELENLEIIQGDCMDVMKQFPDGYFHLAIVDPPYGIDINASGRLGHYGGKGKKWDNSAPNEEYFKELFRVSTNQIVWGGNYFQMPPTRCFLIWDKQQPQGVSFASCEYAWTSFDRSAKTFYKRPQGADEQRIHPTQKPRHLYDWLYKNYSDKGARVLDTHLGSGSNAIAAHYFGVGEFVGVELDKDYYNAACKRIKEQTTQLKLF